LTNVLWKNGWLFTGKETGLRGATDSWSGYILLDLIKKETDLYIRIYEKSTQMWRDATKAELKTIVAGRKMMEGMDAPFGFFALYQKEGQPTTFKFKLLLDTSAKRDKTGIVSTSISSGVLRELIARLQGMFAGDPPIVPNFGIKENRSNRTYLSSWVAYYMGMLGRLRIPPVYKI
jgi:hypothetical protein